MPASDRVGRRIKLQDLHVLMAVSKAGSMGKAARVLNTTQPAVSRSIAELEGILGVRLLDRSPRGIEPTTYGRALLDCGVAVFDELHQGLKNVAFLADPTVGEIRIGGNDAIIGGLLPAVFGRLHRKYAGISIHVANLTVLAEQYRALQERKIDLILGRIPQQPKTEIVSETLFYDRTFVVASAKSSWARRRRIEFSELVNEPWAVPPADTLVGSIFADAFRAKGVAYPPKCVATGTIHLFCALLASGPFLSIFPGSTLHFGANLPPLKVLPVDLPVPPSPIGILS
jgi:DNA-binding transcriptional LysR family regulator